MQDGKAGPIFVQFENASQGGTVAVVSHAVESAIACLDLFAFESPQIVCFSEAVQ